LLKPLKKNPYFVGEKKDLNDEGKRERIKRGKEKCVQREREREREREGWERSE